MIIGDKTLDGKLITSLSRGSERLVKAECDNCSCCMTIKWTNHFRSQERKGFDGKTYCRSCQSKVNLKKARKNGPWNKGKRIPLDQRKGKPYITSDGYKAIFQYQYDRSHHSQWANYRKEHLVVMEKFLGRQLNKNEVIHHIDGDKINNTIDNLWLTSSKGHRKAHTSLQDIGYNLLKLGIVKFDKEKGEYFLAKKDMLCI